MRARVGVGAIPHPSRMRSYSRYHRPRLLLITFAKFRFLDMISVIYKIGTSGRSLRSFKSLKSLRSRNTRSLTSMTSLMSLRESRCHTARIGSCAACCALKASKVDWANGEARICRGAATRPFENEVQPLCPRHFDMSLRRLRNPPPFVSERR